MFSMWKCKRGNILDIISVKVPSEDILELVVAVQFILGLVSFFGYASNNYEFKTKENKI